MTHAGKVKKKLIFTLVARSTARNSTELNSCKLYDFCSFSVTVTIVKNWHRCRAPKTNVDYDCIGYRISDAKSYRFLAKNDQIERKNLYLYNRIARLNFDFQLLILWYKFLNQLTFIKKSICLTLCL